MFEDEYVDVKILTRMTFSVDINKVFDSVN